MKTNQILTPPLTLGSFRVEHKTGLVHMGDLFHLGNVYRHRDGLPNLPFNAWANRVDVKEYASYLESQGQTGFVRKRGRNGGTWANLKLAIDAAMALSVTFKDEVISTFLSGKILPLRDESGDLFKDMNAALEMAAESVLGKPAHKGHYIQLAKIIKDRIGVENWNTCGPEALALRSEIEERLAIMLRAGVVRDWDHLKELAGKV